VLQVNEKAKKLMKEQSEGVYDTLKNHFNLPVFQDDIAEDEIPSEFNYFLLVYGDMTPTDTSRNLIQEVYVTYITENNDMVDEETVDIISLISILKNIDFVRSIKQRLQKKDTDDYIDQVDIIFKRKIPYGCQI
jgi:uncharacterized protein YuzB (UPF0349 family)